MQNMKEKSKILLQDQFFTSILKHVQVTNVPRLLTHYPERNRYYKVVQGTSKKVLWDSTKEDSPKSFMAIPDDVIIFVERTKQEISRIEYIGYLHKEPTLEKITSFLHTPLSLGERKAWQVIDIFTVISRASYQEELDILMSRFRRFEDIAEGCIIRACHLIGIEPVYHPYQEN